VHLSRGAILCVKKHLTVSCGRRDYKKNEHKEVEVEEIYGAQQAKTVIKDAMDLYNELYVAKRKR
jgi:inorganic pyrophosphatase